MAAVCRKCQSAGVSIPDWVPGESSQIASNHCTANEKTIPADAKHRSMKTGDNFENYYRDCRKSHFDKLIF